MARRNLIALSVRQPFAELIMRGEKTVEYRRQPTNQRGRVYVYASQTRFHAEHEGYLCAEFDLDPEDLPRGVIVGTVEIVDCQRDDGEFAWELAKPRRLARPLRPKRRPQPVWFYPFREPSEAD